MIRAYAHEDDTLRDVAVPEGMAGAVWIDLEDPTIEELETVGGLVGATLPGRAEMEEIELSSRLYQDEGAKVMTIIVPTRPEDGSTTVGPVTFVLVHRWLVSIRYHDPRPFTSYPPRAGRSGYGCASPEAVLHGLVEEIIDRLADILERIGSEMDDLSRSIFRPAERGEREVRNLQLALERIGREGDLLGDIRISLTTIERLLGFLGQVEEGAGAGRVLRRALRTQSNDVRSLAEHAGFLSQKITLVLEATLGMISIEQNATIKIFTVVAVIFLPPTLIASIYGMNFALMPETGWTLGYPFALLLMLASAALTYLFFKRKGWL